MKRLPKFLSLLAAAALVTAAAADAAYAVPFQPPGPECQTPLPSSNMTRVTIQAGDTLFAIAQKSLGDGNRWTEITHLDGTPFTEAQAENLQVGDVVLVPAS